MPENLRRCAIYIRVSTVEQQIHGKSLNAQEEYLVRYANEQQMIITGIYADEGKTARKELKKRKAIHSLLGAVKRREVDIVLFFRLDRWFRNMSDFYKVQEILDEYNVRWISVSEPGLSMETRDGRLQLNVVLSIGQNEVDTTSERIKFVNEASIRQGKLIFGKSNMPFGYTTGILDGKKSMIKDSQTAHMVSDFYNHYKKHQNKSEAVRYMQETYHIEFSYTNLKTMLSSEFYKGTYRGFPYCPAYLSEHEWLEIQEISNKNIKCSRSSRIYLFAGLINCPVCGQKLSGTGCTSTTNNKARNYCYYRCNKAAISKLCSFQYRIKQKMLEELLLSYLETEYKNFCFQHKSTKPAIKKIKSFQSLDSVSKEMERLNLLFQKGRISWDYYAKEYNRLELKLREHAIESPPKDIDYTYLSNILSQDFSKLYYILTPENQRSFWRNIINKIYCAESGDILKVDFFSSVLY